MTASPLPWPSRLTADPDRLTHILANLLIVLAFLLACASAPSRADEPPVSASSTPSR